MSPTRSKSALPAETIVVVCRGCERELRFKSVHAGARKSCKCGFELRVPGAEARVRGEARVEGLLKVVIGLGVAGVSFFVASSIGAWFYGVTAFGMAMAVKGLISLATGVEEVELDRRGL